MKERLNKILEYYKITPAQLADNIGVQRSSVSHIFSERNKPSYDFLVKILSKFTQIDANWLITGVGNMLNQDINTIGTKKPLQQQDLFTNESQIFNKQENIQVPNPNLKADTGPLKKDISSSKDLKDYGFTNVNKVKSIILLYDDNTFEIINKK